MNNLRRATNSSATLALFALMVVPGILTALDLRPVDFTADHRPEPPALPSGPREILSFPGSFKYYFKESFATRDLALELHGRVMVDLFGCSPSTRVLLGREGWLYLRGEGALDLHRRLEPFDEVELGNWMDSLEDWRRVAEANGSTFVFFIAPDKHTIYPQYIPSKYARADRARRRLQLAKAANDRGLAVVDPTDQLIGAAASQRIYHKTDTHWNALGARLGTAVLMQRIAELTNTRLEEPTPSTRFEVTQGGDKSRLIGLKRLMLEEVPIVDLTPTRAVLDEDGEPLARPVMDGRLLVADRLVTSCPDGEIERGVIHIDSFGNVMIPFLARAFQRCVFVRSASIDRELIESEKPDVVILELVERRLMTPDPAMLR